MAIAFDASASVTAALNPASAGWTHITGSGSNRILIVGVMARDSGSATDVAVSTVTYNGVALTKIRHNTTVSGTCRVELWYLINPPTGSFTVTVTWTGNVEDVGVAGSMSFSGVDQTAPIEANNGFDSTVNDTQVSASVTTVTDNAWGVSVMFTGSPNSIAAGGGATQVHHQPGIGLGGGGSADGFSMAYFGPHTPAGALAMSYSWSDSQRAAISVAALKAFGAGGGGITLQQVERGRSVVRGLLRGL